MDIIKEKMGGKILYTVKAGNMNLQTYPSIRG